MYDAGVPTTIYVNVTNVDRVDYRLYRMPRQDVLRLVSRDSYQAWQTYRGGSSELVRQWSQAVQAPLNASRFISTTLAATPGRAADARRLLPGGHRGRRVLRRPGTCSSSPGST